MREKSSNLVDVCADSAAKHGPCRSIARAIQKASSRCPPKRNDFRLISVFRFSLFFEHDLVRKPVAILGSSPRTGFFGIMLWRQPPQRGVYHKRRTKRCGAGNAIGTAINRLYHIMLPHFHGQSAPARGGKASPSSTCPCEPKLSATPSRGHLFCQAPTNPADATCCGRPRCSSALRSETRAPSSTRLSR